MTVTPPAARARRPRHRTGWVPFALVALVAFPLVAGVLRLVEIAGGPALLPANPRIAGFPTPAVVHIAGALVFCLAGAFQFSSALRRRHPRRHRLAGRVVVAAGLAVALSGLWMTLLADRPEATGPLLQVVRTVVGTATAGCLVLGVAAIRRHDVAAHRAWMTRGYALAVGAGTQVLTQSAAVALFGATEVGNTSGLAAGWLVNLAVAEILLRRTGRQATTRDRGARRVVPESAGAS